MRLAANPRRARLPRRIHIRNQHEPSLREHFSSVYLALAAVVVALAVERLLGRFHEVSDLQSYAANPVLVWIQFAIVIGFASLYWWVTARWAISLRWRLGLFDAVYPLAFLVLIDFVIASIGDSTTRWFVSLGITSVFSAAGYIINVWRSASLPENADRVVVRRFLIPAGVLAITGVAMLVTATVGGSNIAGPAAASWITVFFAAAGCIFGFLEHRVWRVAASKCAMVGC